MLFSILLFFSVPHSWLSASIFVNDYIMWLGGYLFNIIPATRNSLDCMIWKPGTLSSISICPIVVVVLLVICKNLDDLA